MAVRVIQNVDVASGDTRLSKEFVQVATPEDVASAISTLQKNLNAQLNRLDIEMKRLKNQI